MTAWQVPRTRTGRILSAAIIGLALPAAAILALLGAADAGWLDRPIQRWASHRLGRAVTFRSLHVDLLARRPRVEVEGLGIANPPWLGGGRVAEVATLAATLRPSALLRGSFEPTTLALRGVSLHLFRAAAGKTNWSFGQARKGRRAFAILRRVQRLTIADGQVDLIDIPRKLRFRASLRHAGGGSMPLRLAGAGELDAVPLRLAARGGPLHGAAVDRPYPFAARLIDGATIVAARGSSGEPFDLTSFTLAIDARGPNLADLGYLFKLRAPNSPPFRLATTARGDGARFTFNPLRVQVGDSDLRGWLRSDHGAPRHRVTAVFRSAVWTREDLRAVLAPIPPRTLARSRSGAVPRADRSRWILPDAAFPLDNLRAIDLRAQVHVGALRGYPLPLTRLAARFDLEDGKLTYSGVRAELYGGQLAGRAVLDVRGPAPVLSVAGRVGGVQLSRISARSATPLSGELAVTARLRGVGGSIHEAASTAMGTAAVRIGPGSIPPAAAFMLGGDMLRALGSMGDVRRPIALDCLSGNFRAVRGRLATDDLVIRTAAGDTLGRGTLDLREERVRFTLSGQARRRRPLKLAMPILIEGPARRPSVSLLPARNATKLGLRGGLGIVLSPLAALLPLDRQAKVDARCS